MEQKENSWKLGETVSFPFTSTEFKKSGSTFYKHYYSSSFICIREEDEGHRGILLKVLGRTSAQNILIVGGEPFCKDEKEEMISGKTYASYRFPKSTEVSEVIEILSKNPELKDLLEREDMHINLHASFWVRETASKFLVMRQPQYWDPDDESFHTVSDKAPHYRLAMVYFFKGELIV